MSRMESPSQSWVASVTETLLYTLNHSLLREGALNEQFEGSRVGRGGSKAGFVGGFGGVGWGQYMVRNTLQDHAQQKVDARQQWA
jgi:hypothetical protein